MATVTLSSRPGVYELPSYSLTGDLLGYLRCGLQYRYTRLGKMPSRSPVQLWFGNFIHGVLDEGFRIYDQAIKAKSPPAKALAAIDPVAVIATIEKRLAAQGLVAWEPWLKTLGYARAQVALRDLAPVLFPLIHRSEVRLTGARELKPLPKGTAFREADRYEMVGVIDVVTDSRCLEARVGGATRSAYSRRRFGAALPRRDPGRARGPGEAALVR